MDFLLSHMPKSISPVSTLTDVPFPFTFLPLFPLFDTYLSHSLFFLFPFLSIIIFLRLYVTDNVPVALILI